MRRYIVGFFAILGAVVFFVLCLGVGLAIWSQVSGPRIAEGTVLTLDLTQALPDEPDGDGISRLFFPTGMTLADTLGALERAGDDPRVTGLVARIGDSPMGFAEVQELRDAIAQFRAKGKHAVAYADTFGELSSGTRSYYLAAAFNEIWLQRLGMVGLVGLRAELNYFRGTLDMLGIVPDFAHREEYKDAANTMTETAMTPPEREEINALLQSIYGQVITGIAADRKIAPDALNALVDRAPLMLDEALEAHLVDHAGDRENAIGSFGADPPLLSLARYFDEAGPPHQSGPTIALIYGTGLMARGGGGDNPLTGDNVLGADELTRAFRLAQQDKSVRAILFRIDSPGGSAVAAETIWAAVKRARDAGKPVIVSMGDVAGSGGYYVAAPADKIVAEPATLTGSIGVVAGKLVFGGLAKKLGANWDSAQIGTNAGIFSMLEDFTPSEHERLEAVLDNIYGTFKSRVAEGRKLDSAAVEAVAKGRVWSGEDASTRGLVDTLGGMRTALDLAKTAAGVPADQDVTLKLYPTPKTGAALLLARLRGSNDDEAVLPLRVMDLLRASAAQLDSLLTPVGALMMRPLRLQ